MHNLISEFIAICDEAYTRAYNEGFSYGVLYRKKESTAETIIRILEKRFKFKTAPKFKYKLMTLSCNECDDIWGPMFEKDRKKILQGLKKFRIVLNAKGELDLKNVFVE